MWGELISLCNTYNTKLNLVQVDTKAYDPVKLDKNTKVLERVACGGTILNPGIEKLEEFNIKYDALVVTTDGYLESFDIDCFNELNKPIIWLILNNGRNVINNFNKGKMLGVRLKV